MRCFRFSVDWECITIEISLHGSIWVMLNTFTEIGHWSHLSRLWLKCYTHFSQTIINVAAPHIHTWQLRGNKKINVQLHVHIVVKQHTQFKVYTTLVTFVWDTSKLSKWHHLDKCLMLKFISRLILRQSSFEMAAVLTLHHSSRETRSDRDTLLDHSMVLTKQILTNTHIIENVHHHGCGLLVNVCY